MANNTFLTKSDGQKLYLAIDDAKNIYVSNDNFNSTIKDVNKQNLDTVTLFSQKLDQIQATIDSLPNIYQPLGNYVTADQFNTHNTDLQKLYQPVGNYITVDEQKRDLNNLGNVYQPLGNYITEDNFKQELTNINGIYQPRGNYITEDQFQKNNQDLEAIYQLKGDYITSNQFNSHNAELANFYQPKGDYITSDLFNSHNAELATLYQPKGDYITSDQFNSHNAELASLYQPKGDYITSDQFNQSLSFVENAYQPRGNYVTSEELNYRLQSQQPENIEELADEVEYIKTKLNIKREFEQIIPLEGVYLLKRKDYQSPDEMELLTIAKINDVEYQFTHSKLNTKLGVIISFGDREKMVLSRVYKQIPGFVLLKMNMGGEMRSNNSFIAFKLDQPGEKYVGVYMMMGSEKFEIGELNKLPTTEDAEKFLSKQYNRDFKTISFQEYNQMKFQEGVSVQGIYMSDPIVRNDSETATLFTVRGTDVERVYQMIVYNINGLGRQMRKLAEFSLEKVDQPTLENHTLFKANMNGEILPFYIAFRKIEGGFGYDQLSTAIEKDGIVQTNEENRDAITARLITVEPNQNILPFLNSRFMGEGEFTIV